MLVAALVATVAMTAQAAPLAPLAPTTSNIVVTDAAGNRLVVNPLLSVGQTIVVRVTGFQPRETVLVGPAALAWTSGELTADDSGVVSQQLRVPEAAADQPRGLLTLVGTEVPPSPQSSAPTSATSSAATSSTANIEVGLTNTAVFTFHTGPPTGPAPPAGPAPTGPNPGTLAFTGGYLDTMWQLALGLLALGVLLVLAGHGLAGSRLAGRAEPAARRPQQRPAEPA